MLLIAAALKEELDVALSLCEKQERIRRGGVDYWRAERNGRMMHFLKTGVGPRRSAECLERALGVLEVTHVLVIGYAGALDPELKLGTLVVVGKALACRIDEANPDVENMILEKTFALAPGDSLVRTSEALRLPVHCGDTLTSSHVWGNPDHKEILLRKFQACIVDMETAALAGISKNENIPLRCIRVISDEAGDTFLEPFSYNPSAGIQKRAGQLLRKGSPVRAFRKWKRNASAARDRLGRFLSEYL